jgi:hypothetical protein
MEMVMKEGRIVVMMIKCNDNNAEMKGITDDDGLHSSVTAEL